MALGSEIKLGRATIPTGYHRISSLSWEWPKNEVKFVVDIFPTTQDAQMVEHPPKVELFEMPDYSDTENPTTKIVENITIPAWTEKPTPLTSQLYTFDFANVQPPADLIQQIFALPQEQQDAVCFALLKTLLYERLKAIPDYQNSQDI